MYSSLREFSSDEWDRLNAWLDRIYDDFTAKVAAARGLSAERMDEVARGRVWTGADAKQHGLVDELGGLRTALELAGDRAGLPASAEIEARLYPRVPLIARMRPAQSSEDPAAATARLRIEGWGAWAAMAMRLGLSTYGPLSLADDHYLT
jgi:protease IV